jgi:hypothetical protein
VTSVYRRHGFRSAQRHGFDRRPQPSSRSPGGGGDGSLAELAELVIVHPADHKRVRAEYRGVAGEVGRRFAELGPVGNRSQSTSPWPLR